MLHTNRVFSPQILLRTFDCATWSPSLQHVLELFQHLPLCQWRSSRRNDMSQMKIRSAKKKVVTMPTHTHTPTYFHPERTSKTTKILCTCKLHMLGRLTWIQPKETPVTSLPRRRPGRGAEHPLLLSPATTSLGNVGTWWAPSNRSHSGANRKPPNKKTWQW